MSSLIWLASYPKSGNTWLRALFSHYLADETGFDFNSLLGHSIADSRSLFDELVGLPSGELSSAQVQQLLPLFHELLAGEFGPKHLVKTHRLFQYTESGSALFSSNSTQCAIYLVRNPLDVAVSYAPFVDMPLDEIVELLGKADTMIDRPAETGSQTLPCPLGSWSAHVSGWRDQSEVPVLMVRYEDLLTDTAACFEKILRFAGYDIDEMRITKAVADCAFATLAAQEKHSGFTQVPVVKGRFFRKGVAGDGRKELCLDQIARIESAHRDIMIDFGYLTDTPTRSRI